MANAKKNTPAAATVADKLAAIEAACTGMKAANMDASFIDTFRKNALKDLVGPIRDEIATYFSDTLSGMSEDDKVTDNLTALNGGKIVLTISFDDGEMSVEAKASGTSNGSRSASKSAGNILVVNEKGFDNFSTLTRYLGIFKEHDSQARVYRKASAKDSATFPPVQTVPADQFKVDVHAPKGYYVTKTIDGNETAVQD